MRLPLPKGVYAETAGSAPHTPPLDGDRRISVAIIGGGFTGLSAALRLAEKGVDVVVLEAHEPGWGASGRNGGQVNPGLKHDPDKIEADFGPDLGRRMVRLSGNAPNTVFDLIRHHRISCEALQSGTLRAAISARSASDVRATAAQWVAREAPVTLLDAAACAASTGTDHYRAALLDRRGGHLNPLSYARGLAAAAARAGAKVHGGTPAQRIHRIGNAWRVETPCGIVTAEKLILATSGYTGNLWPGLSRSIVPLYSAIVASEPLPDELAQAIMPTRSVLYEMGEVTVYYRIDRQNRLLMGGRSVQRDVGSPDDLRYLSNYAIKLWPDLRTTRWTHAWSGQLAVTQDHYPHVHEPHETVLACLGYNGRGVAMSTAMGPELARRVIGGPSAAIDMPVTAVREIPFHGLWRSAVMARMAYGRIRDWLGL
jgi:glycine/D-amino acid oxidase-like deaminating enzyme